MGKQEIKYDALKIGNLEARVPIIQGGMGVGISLGGLAGAVAKEGGVGIISSAQIGYREPDFESNTVECNIRAIKKEYEKARKIAPTGVIGFNVMVAIQHYEDYVRAIAKVGADLIISGAGLPTELPRYVEGTETKIAPIVSSVKSAQVILKYWDKKFNRTADFVVIEGPKAGGHLGFSEQQISFYENPESGERISGMCENYEEEIIQIRNLIAVYEDKYETDIPVVVAGGISTAEEVRKYMNMGVQAVQVATRFITTEECDADRAYKDAFINATKDDIQIVKSPVGMPGRAIKNQFMERVMSGERFAPKKCLRCLKKCNPAEIPYCITEALIHAAKGELEYALLFCGANGYRASHIESVHDVMASLQS